MANLVIPPYEVFTDANGDPLEDGFIFIGEPGLSPITNPLQAFFDADLTIPASNIRTKGGYPANSGSPARLYTATNYSIVVQDKNQNTLYTQLDSVDYINSASGSLIALVDTIADLRGLALANPDDQASVGGSVTVGDGLMGPLYYWNAASSLVDNGVSIIKPTSTSGNGRWLWINTNAPMEDVAITVTGTLTLAFKNRLFLVNNPLAAVLAVPDGDFQGQRIEIANRAVSTVQITGSGIPANSFITESALLTWVGTVWSVSYKYGYIIGNASKDTNAVSLSEYDSELASDVKAGSVFDNNGIIITVYADATPTGYAGITVSTTFYIYYDESAGVFIFSEDVPVWSDALQGWYTGTDRALFSMFKDAGGTLYQNKNFLVAQNNYAFPNSIAVAGDITAVNATLTGRITWRDYYKVIGATKGTIYDVLVTWLSGSGRMKSAYGQLNTGGVQSSIQSVRRFDATTIRIVSINSSAAGNTVTDDFTSADGTVIPSIEIMTNFDEL